MTNDVRSFLEVEMLGELPSGMPVAMDKYAYDADAFVVVNRVKPSSATLRRDHRGDRRPHHRYPAATV